MERQVRAAINKTGTGHHINEVDPRFEDKLAHAADALSSATGHKRDGEALISKAMKIVGKAEAEVRRLRYQGPQGRITNYAKKYPNSRY